MEQTKTILKKTWVVAALACVCCLLWGSAIPLIKTGYRLMQMVLQIRQVRSFLQVCVLHWQESLY